jgi:hypothetical protein
VSNASDHEIIHIPAMPEDVFPECDSTRLTKRGAGPYSKFEMSRIVESARFPGRRYPIIVYANRPSHLSSIPDFSHTNVCAVKYLHVTFNYTNEFPLDKQIMCEAAQFSCIGSIRADHLSQLVLANISSDANSRAEKLDHRRDPLNNKGAI